MCQPYPDHVYLKHCYGQKSNRRYRIHSFDTVFSECAYAYIGKKKKKKVWVTVPVPEAKLDR